MCTTTFVIGTSSDSTATGVPIDQSMPRRLKQHSSRLLRTTWANWIHGRSNNDGEIQAATAGRIRILGCSSFPSFLTRLGCVPPAKRSSRHYWHPKLAQFGFAGQSGQTDQINHVNWSDRSGKYCQITNWTALLHRSRRDDWNAYIEHLIWNPDKEVMPNTYTWV